MGAAGAKDLVHSGWDVWRALAVSLLVDGPTCTSVVVFVCWTWAGEAGTRQLVRYGRVELCAVGLYLWVFCLWQGGLLRL